MNVIAEIQRINDYELEKGLVGTAASWHTKYADSAWVYVGNLPLNLTEGDVICILSQFGEVRVVPFHTPSSANLGATF
jgi:RNA-binding motif X-linked protein 2